MAGNLETASVPERPRSLRGLCGAAFLVSALVTAAVLYRDTTAYIEHERPLIQITRLVKLQHELPAKYDFHREGDMIRYQTNIREPARASQGLPYFSPHVHVCIKDGRVHCLYDLKASAAELARIEKLLTKEFADLVQVRPEDLRIEVIQEMRVENPQPIKRWPW
jgi:hypothetical protein